MRKIIAAAALAATAAGAAAGITATAATKPRDTVAKCVISGAETFVANGDVRIYGIDRPDSRTGTRTAIYACVFRNGKRIPVGTAESPFDDDTTGPIRYIRSLRITVEGGGIQGFLAYVSTSCPDSDGPCSERVVVRSLSSGKTVLRRKAGSGFDRIALDVTTDPGDYSLGWLENSDGGNCEDGCRVHRVQKSGDEVLDEGTDIDADSFAFVDASAPGIVEFSGAGGFIWKRGDVYKRANFYRDEE